MKPYIAQIRANLRLMARDRSVIFFNYFFPLMFFVIFAVSFGGSKNPGSMAQVVNMVLVLGVLGSGFFGAGIRAVQDRESNILRRFKVAPVGAAPIIVASLVSGLVSFLPSVLLILGLAHFWLHLPFPARPADFVLFVCFGCLAFRAVGMIVAAVVNSTQESQIVTQILYLPMLFLSGATFPIQFFPKWLQTLAQFVPSTYLFQGMQSILIANGNLVTNAAPVGALLVTLAVSVFLGVKLFRWEKEQKIARRAKLWVLVVLAPFLLLGIYQAKSKTNLAQDKLLARQMRRNETVLIENARIFVGNGQVIPSGAVLVSGGKIAQVFDSSPANAAALNATVVNAAGKTLLPGLIDMHVHLGSPGGIYNNPADYAKPDAQQRELESYLYSGIGAVRSVGDPLDMSLRLRESVASGREVGSQVFGCGPMFTAEGGHGTEYLKVLPENMRGAVEQQLVRIPNSVNQARAQVHELKLRGVDCIKAVLDTGTAGMLFNRLDNQLYEAIANQAHADGLPLATHTGEVADVKEAVASGTISVEHGSMRSLIPPAVFEQMRIKGIAYDPTLSAVEALGSLARQDDSLLDRSLLQQVGPKDLIDSTRAAVHANNLAEQFGMADSSRALQLAQANLRAAYKAGVLLIAGSDAGNLLVFHGPTVQHELQLWVDAGIPPGIALRAATGNAAQVLRAHSRIGLIQPGRDATLLLVEGNPVDDISILERITFVMFRGERLDRSELFDQHNPD